MRVSLATIALSLAATLLIGGCPTAQTTPGPNPFLTLAEQFGASSLTTSDQTMTGGGSVEQVELPFRQEMTVTLANNSPEADLQVSIAAWVLPSSLRSQEQEDALINGGYTRIDTEIKLGSAFVLPAGTFVRDFGGVAGAENLLIQAADSDDPLFVSDGNMENRGLMGRVADTPREVQRTLVTPDVLLVYLEPPRSCDSVAFEFLRNGVPIRQNKIQDDTFTGATNTGGRKTLAQIDAYQCDPFMPGLFFKAGGGAREDNEFFEGQNVRVDFFLEAFSDGTAAQVTVQ